MRHDAMRGLTAVLITGAALGLAGCNTASGIGKDATSAWDAITGSGSSATTPSSTQTATTSTSPAATTTGVSSGTTTSAAAPSTPAATETPMVSRDTVKQAQSKLHDQGLYRGPIDGLAGPKTHRAVLAYQKKQGMTQTGQLDTATVNSLTGKM
jgi:peptidoglycan hydrolase-like protein with peptidoglycan-binding domain